MTPQQIDLVPDAVLADSRRLLDYLARRGLAMTLLELDSERRRRGITPRASSSQVRAKAKARSGR